MSRLKICYVRSLDHQSAILCSPGSGGCLDAARLCLLAAGVAVPAPWSVADTGCAGPGACFSSSFAAWPTVALRFLVLTLGNVMPKAWATCIPKQSDAGNGCNLCQLIMSYLHEG